jgi:3-deoxy-manno-octulosonate cytidylyltransferase (CMP-KDO synthetase)
MIDWVIAASKQTGADEVLVATDDERIAKATPHCSVMTRAEHASGTDRIAEVASSRHWNDETIVVNVQGDEPQLPSQLIDQVAAILQERTDAHVATLCTAIITLDEFLNPNAVKVVVDAGGTALYFSRAPIPWDRDGAPHGLGSQARFSGAYRHLGIYAYRVAALRKLSQLPPSRLESLEKLEQLRALEAGMRIVVGIATVAPPAGIDTADDLERVRATLTGK